MLDALVIKEWLLVYFIVLTGLSIGNLYVLIKVRSMLSTLLHENELVQYLKSKP